MTFEPLNISLDEGCIASFIRRYHFNEDDKNDILKVYRQIAPRIHAEFHYVVDETSEGKRAVVVMTLGQAFDEYQASVVESGNIQKAYMIECLGTEIMSMSYHEIDKRIYELTDLYMGNYIFAGSDELPLSDIPMLMSKLGQKQISYNEAYVLIPKKSVVFVAPLLKEKPIKHNGCRKCKSQNCQLRQEEYEGDDMGNNAKAHDESSRTSSMDETAGMIHLYTGDGKGKTTAATGLAVRAAGAGRKVVFTQFMKGRDTSELNSLIKLDNVEIIRNNEDLGWFKRDDEEQVALYTKVHNEILDKIENRVKENKCDVLILDEATYPCNYGIIDVQRLRKLIVNRPKTMEVVVTGRNADDFFADNADYITEMKKIKHPYDRGIQARYGIEY